MLDGFKVKITKDDITFGPKDVIHPLVALTVASELNQQGYRRCSNAYCMIARIDRDDWLDVLAKERRCSRADFYNVDGSGISNQHRDHYIRVHSKDEHTVHPAVYHHIERY